jgi:uncharacterized integral membrane protein
MLNSVSVLAEADRSTMTLRVTIIDSSGDVWSSPLGMHIPAMMAVIGGVLILLSAHIPVHFVRRMRKIRRR